MAQCLALLKSIVKTNSARKVRLSVRSLVHMYDFGINKEKLVVKVWISSLFIIRLENIKFHPQYVWLTNS